MKKLGPWTCGLSFSIFSLTPGAFAFDLSKIWFSGDIGFSSNLIMEDYQQQADDKGLDVTISDPQTGRLSGKLGIGWDFWETQDNQLVIATQFELINLGNVNLDYSTTISESELEGLYTGLKDIHPKSGNGVGIGLTSRWKGSESLNIDPFELGFEIGLMPWWQEYNLAGISESNVRTNSEQGLGGYGGLHFDFQIDPRWSARVGTRLYSMGEELLQSTQVGLTFRPAAKMPEPTIIEVEVEVPAEQSLDDRYAVWRNSSLPLNVLVNDTSLGDNLKITRVTESESGDLVISYDQQRIRYRHKGSRLVVDRFEYWVTNGEEEFGPYNVTIDLVSSPPSANGDSFQVGYGTSSRLDVLANDVDFDGNNLFITSFSEPNSGSLELLDNVLVYKHDGRDSDAVSFNYWVSNGASEVGPVNVDLIILPNVFTIPINFAPSSTVIRGEDKPALNRLSVWMNENPGTRVSIAGHTDSTGQPSMNLTLSMGRAESVMDYLIFQGIDPDRLRAEGFGDTQPLASNSTAEGKLQNRRVEFRLF